MTSPGERNEPARDSGQADDRAPYSAMSPS